MYQCLVRLDLSNLSQSRMLIVFLVRSTPFVCFTTFCMSYSTCVAVFTGGYYLEGNILNTFVPHILQCTKTLFLRGEGLDISLVLLIIIIINTNK